MNVVHIRRKLESDTLHLPELKPLVGKVVEITVQVESTPGISPGTGDWDAAVQAARELENYDFDAWRRQRECDLKHAPNHLP